MDFNEQVLSDNECDYRSGPRDIYNKLARDGNYTKPRPILELIDNAFDAGASEINTKITENSYIQQDNGNSFISAEIDQELHEFYTSDQEKYRRLFKNVKSKIRQKCSPLQQLDYEEGSSGYNNWGFKGAMAYHESMGTIYSWNKFFMIIIHLNYPKMKRKNRFKSGTTIKIYPKDELPEDIRREYNDELIKKESKYSINSGTLIVEQFTRNPLNIPQVGTPQENDIEHNDLL